MTSSPDIEGDAKWLAAGEDPATDPRINDPYWLEFERKRAEAGS